MEKSKRLSQLMVRKVLYLFIFFNLISLNSISQEKFGCVSGCIDSIINSIESNTTYSLLLANFKNGLVLMDGKHEMIYKQKQVLKWIDKVDKDSVKAYKGKIRRE
jgi:hypothetical protein